jgi:hypothetical protein
MATNAQLQAQVEAMTAALERHGITLEQKAVPDTEKADYIELGSPAHAVFLGLIEVADGDDVEDFITFTSRETGTTYRLEDEVTGFVNYPDPEKAARLVLRQKVSSLESGPPSPPTGSPPMWRPVDMM